MPLCPSSNLTRTPLPIARRSRAPPRSAPRAQIFARNASDVVDLASFQRLMRYNNFEADPLAAANCTGASATPSSAIATRSDLMPPNAVCANPAEEQADNVGIDSKVGAWGVCRSYPLSIAGAVWGAGRGVFALRSPLDVSCVCCALLAPPVAAVCGRRRRLCALQVTSYSLHAAGMVSLAQSGPTYDQQPVFAFSNTTLTGIAHLGMPDAWHFPWVAVSWGPTPLP